jgi:hypothetical protein
MGCAPGSASGLENAGKAQAGGTAASFLFTTTAGSPAFEAGRNDLLTSQCFHLILLLVLILSKLPNTFRNFDFFEVTQSPIFRVVIRHAFGCRHFTVMRLNTLGA